MLENIAERIKGGAKVLGLGVALLFGSTAFAHAQEIDQYKSYFFACNSWEDTYEDNSVRDWDQYHGLKQSFTDDEKIILVGHDPNWVEDQDVELILHGPSGVVEDYTVTLESDGEWHHMGEGRKNGLMYDIMHESNGGDGLYTIEWKYTVGQIDEDVKCSFVVSSSN